MASPILRAPTAQFGFNLFKGELGAPANAGKNVIVSPLCVSTALGMTASGARGQTLKDMNTTLGLPDYGNQDTNSASYANLLAALKGKDLGVKLSVANAIWAREGTEFLDAFFAGTFKHFKAQVNVSNFGDPETLDAINKWVKDNTEGKIDKILDSLSPDSVMVLLNALYFKGTWTNQFDKALTKDATFHAADGDKQHPLMYRHGEMRYLKTGDYQLVALPFGEAKRVHLYVVLPKAGKTVADVAKSLGGDTFFDTCKDSLFESEGQLWLPRFKLEYKAELNATLKALGMGSAFEGADFSGIRKENDVKISKVVHRVVCSFDEEGGELAAATAVDMVCESVAAQPWQMRVDRPFIAVLADEETRTVIGAGAVLNP